ncbi:hemolysin activation protein [Anaerocolumna chitinilytica]|uniref:Hemolytic protein HlpA n=1 Tax=Anaerocolumna chitinilytica TaxID=1727145 RepID=A0A7I8DMP6_9FIRM|nr:hemolysin activation protein [Anaerocolumna chitinilytica]BCJ99649.1 hemolytic protein HlpA [Anaerocolumna chitinilytica]
MKEAKIDIAVLLIFFARPKQFEQVFAVIKEAKPSRLYLYQDGPRKGRSEDMAGIIKCRAIAFDIDWNCEIHTFFQSENVGCDPSEYIAQKWMFQTEEEGIILEDDDVPSLSFFPFCKELLKKYREDERINMICGMNNTKICEYTPYDYLFTTSGSICGWASWRRVVETWDEKYSILKDPFNLKQFKNYLDSFMEGASYINTLRRHQYAGKAYYETILGSSMHLNHRLNIVPAKNMITNIGVTANATHSVSDIRMLPKGVQRIFNMPAYELEFPIKHPPYVIEDKEFKERIDRVMGKGHPLIRYYRKGASILRRLKYKDYKGLKKSLLRLLRIK